MPDLGNQIRSYYETVVERVDPMTQPVVSSRNASYRPSVVLLTTVVVVLFAIGLAPFLARWAADDPIVDEPTTTVTTPVVPVVPTTLDAPPPDGAVSASPPGLEADLARIVAASWGYVAIGFDSVNGVSSPWRSKDAVSWVSGEAMSGVGTIEWIDSLASWNDQVLAVGFVSDGEQPGSGEFSLFATSDGIEWEPVSVEAFNAPSVVAEVGGELVVIEVTRRSDGTPLVTELHRSVDGVSWSTVEIPPDLIGDQTHFRWVFGASDGAIGLTGNDNRNLLVTLVLDTENQWTRVEQDFGFDFDVADVATGPDIAIAVGTQPMDRTVGSIPRRGTILVWTPDGWTETTDVGPSKQFSGVAFDGLRYVAVGRDGDDLSGVWESSDGLSGWVRIAGGPDTLTEVMPDLIGEPWGSDEYLGSIGTLQRMRGSYRIVFVEELTIQGDGGRIVATDPAPGASLEFGQTIQVVVTQVEATEAGASPWSNAPLDQGQVPNELVHGWSVPEYQVCPALGLVDQSDDAAPRLGGFGSALSYDNPDGPGMRGDSSPCIDCGRSAYGVSLGSVFSSGDVLNSWARWPAFRFDWDDDSLGIIPRPTPSGPYNDIDPETGELTRSRWKANVWLHNDCSYEIWSWISSEHLLQLLSDVRFVEGLTPP